MPNTWLISDLHLGHANIIRYCDRPFGSVREMNETILQNWHRVVNPCDMVYVLGDVAYGRGSRNARWWLKQLAGRILLVKGSHDNGLRVPYCRLLHVGNEDVLLIHNPAHKPSWWAGWVIHGHLHNKAPLVNYVTKRINVSVEAIGYRPINLNAITELIARSAA